MQLFEGQGHGRGTEGSDTLLDQALGHSVQPLDVGVAGVLAGTAMDMHVDEAGDDGIAAQVKAVSAVHTGTHTGDLVALNVDAGADRIKFLVIYRRVF